MNLDNFIPYVSVSITPAAASAYTAFPVGAATYGKSVGNDVLLQNVGVNIAYFKFGTSAAVASAADSVALQPGSAMVLCLGGGDPNANGGIGVPVTGIATISALGTTVVMTMGRGS